MFKEIVIGMLLTTMLDTVMRGILDFQDLDELRFQGDITTGIPANFLVRGQELPIIANALRFQRTNVNRSGASGVSNTYAVNGEFSRLTASFVVADGATRSSSVIFWDWDLVSIGGAQR